MSRLVSNNIDLDLNAQIPIPINFAIADVVEPSKRKRNFSKEIELPDTANNRAFFAGAFSLHVTDDSINFDATEKAPAFYEKKGIKVFPDAVIQLKKVIRLDDSEGKAKLKIYIQLYSETVDAFLLLSNININEFDWSAYDHPLSQANIAATWVATAGTGYYYPLIERGTIRPGEFIWQTNDFIPYVYFREVFIKCLEYAGIEYDSDFIDTDRFKNMLFGYGGGNIKSLTQADIDQREIEVNTGVFTDSQEVYPFQPPGVVIIAGVPQPAIVHSTFVRSVFNDINFTNNIIQDDLTQFVDGSIFVQRTGNYNIAISGELNWIYNVGAMTWNNSGSPYVEILRNGAIISTSPFGWTTVGFDDHAISGTTSYSKIQNFFLSSGDIIEFRISPRKAFAEVPAGVTKENITLDITTTTSWTIDMDCTNGFITDGGTVSLSKFIPPMRADKFFLGAIRQANLYLDDPNVYNVQKIEPLIDYYLPTNQFDDISDLIDYKKPFIVKPSANNFAKTILFNYKKNKDHDAATYLEKYEQEYGDYTYIQGSYFAKKEQKFEMPWSTIVPFGLTNGIIVPRFITFDANNNVKPNKGEPRVMMRNDLKDGDWTLQNSSAPLSPMNYTTYPSVHHFDDWEDPSFDLNWWLVQELFHAASIVTNVNSFNEYYAEFIQERTNSAAKDIDCYVKWSTADVKANNFAKLKMINGSLFRLNQILDFDDEKAPSAHIELVKVLKARKPPAVKITLPVEQPPLPNAKSRPKVVGTRYVSTSVTINIEEDEFIFIEQPNLTMVLRAEVGFYEGTVLEFANVSTGIATVDTTPFLVNGETSITFFPNEAVKLTCGKNGWTAS